MNQQESDTQILMKGCGECHNCFYHITKSENENPFENYCKLKIIIHEKCGQECIDCTLDVANFGLVCKNLVKDYITSQYKVNKLQEILS